MTDLNVTKRQFRNAIEVFVRGFCVGKSMTHPYEYARVDGVWWMRDADRKNPRNYRKEEFVASGTAPARVDQIARRHTRGRFFVCDIVPAGTKPDWRKLKFKELGYRLLATEPFFIHRLRRIPRAVSPAKVVLVRTEKLARALGKATRMKPLTAQMLGNKAPFRQYVATMSNEIVGWVRSVSAGPSNWCSTLGVVSSQRRRGIGTALLAKMLRDDRKLNAASSVLLASHTGALLYPRIGYEQIGTLYIYAPRKNGG
jgi:hypothetical protein